MNDRVAVLLSGGLDSAVMLAQLVKHYQHVQPVYLRCGLFWEEMELEFLRKFLSAFNNTAIQEVQELSLQLDDVFGEGWYTHSTRTPSYYDPDENWMIPGRNLILISKNVLIGECFVWL